jgi:flagellar basal-body rod protein FlgG
MGADLFQILNISQQDMLQRVHDLDVVSNNLANVNTPGFKKSRANFQELLTALGKDGTHLSSTQILMEQGNISATTNPLDLAISGEGFFQYRLADGKTGYSRDGQLHIDETNRLVNSDGNPLIWSGTLPANTTEVAVANDGTVNVRQGNTNWTPVGNIQIARFINPSGLLNNGQNIFLSSVDSGAAQTAAPGTTGYGTVNGGAIEAGNTNLADELTHMITLQRAFQLSTSAFQQTDQMISEAIQMRR